MRLRQQQYARVGDEAVAALFVRHLQGKPPVRSSSRRTVGDGKFDGRGIELVAVRRLRLDEVGLALLDRPPDRGLTAFDVHDALAVGGEAVTLLPSLSLTGLSADVLLASALYSAKVAPRASWSDRPAYLSSFDRGDGGAAAAARAEVPALGSRLALPESDAVVGVLTPPVPMTVAGERHRSGTNVTVSKSWWRRRNQVTPRWECGLDRAHVEDLVGHRVPSG